ncbi:hypothetical protein CLV44_1098 [Marinobacterium halophilum]|uniref:Uncharacterized protein n=1 Tax=Marinobacterium halophilum TaxID=267374 RepID=A0A2P8EX74_9GAMM|nr:hypothetical protein [Marinobacterium halophilum]PSL14072.1 hypothetical protein CLV44_1098 [Marinobacterium halophilum]
MSITLGIYSNVAGDKSDFTSGHSWITVTRNSITTAYGLWPDNHPRTLDNGRGSDIIIGLEGTRFPSASRFFKLNKKKSLILELELKKNIGWRYTNTCASWASDVLSTVTGIDIDADDWAGFETPRELGEHINELERTHPTSLVQPKIPNNNDSSSW